jgi:hypothetical protein
MLSILCHFHGLPWGRDQNVKLPKSPFFVHIASLSARSGMLSAVISLGDRSKEAILRIVLSLPVLVSTMSWAASSGSNSRLAEVSLITLNQETKLSFQSLSNQGFVLVAVRDCSVLIDGQSTTLKAGDYKKIPGTQSLELTQSGLTTVPFVLIKIVAATQPLTIEATTLARNQELEDTSGRNATLLVAITSLRLHDVRNLAGEGEHWKSSSQKIIELQQGHTVWLTQGMHRLRNSGNTATQFVTVEW